MNMKLIEQALEVGKRLPVFPTDGKRPCWSNKAWEELTGVPVARGEGGFKLASQEPSVIRQLFSHPRATEIAVPMGPMSQIDCIDIDLYKEGVTEWAERHMPLLSHTRRHHTRSEGIHVFYRHEPDRKLPAQIIDGVDIKSHGGYVCWPPTEGYTQLDRKTRVAPMPAALMDLIEASQSKANGAAPTSGTFNEATDDELVANIINAVDFYASLRTLSWRLVSRGTPGGEIEVALQNIMRDSYASDQHHQRYGDWMERYSKIGELVTSAVEKQRGVASDAAIEAMSKPVDFFDPAVMTRPIGPQRESKPADIEARVAEKLNAGSTTGTASSEKSEYTEMSVAGLRKRLIEPLTWMIDGMIPRGATVSLGGTSNVGKTRWLAALTVLLAAGKTELMGLPKCPAPQRILWIANEERVDDIARRCKAVALQHDLKKSAGWVVRGKDAGMLQLVSVNEIGQPELNEDAIAELVLEIRKAEADAFLIDPYVTISSAMDENSAVSATMITKAMNMITAMTGAAGIHAHHTPKNRALDADWYRADSGAWRGSGAIFSALDCAFTLANYFPPGGGDKKSPRAIWKSNFLRLKLSRWIVLDSAKVREGEPIAPIIYELVGQDMDEGEGNPIGVCRLADEVQAVNSLLAEAIDVMSVAGMALEIYDKMGLGKFSMAAVHKRMIGFTGWPGAKVLRSSDTERLHEQFKTKVLIPGGYRVWLVDEGKGRRSTWKFHLDATKEETDD